MAAAISCMRALPAGRRRMVVTENTPYSTASTPAAIAAHSHWVASIRKSPPGKKAAHYSTPRMLPYRPRARTAASRSDLEFALELAPHRHALDSYVVGQTVAVGRISLPGDQRLEVTPTRHGDAEAVLADVFARQLLFLVGNFGERHVADRPAVGALRPTHDDGHDGIHALQRQLHRRLAHRVRLLDVDLGGDVPRCALQVVGDRPVVLVAVRLAHHVGHDRCDTAELRMSEGVPCAGIREEFAVGIRHTFGGHDDAVAVAFDRGTHALEEALLLEGHLGKENDVRRLRGALAREPTGRRDPAGVPPHDLQHEHARRGTGHRGDVERRLARGDRDVLGHRAEARAAIGVRQVVVDCLGYADAGDRKAERGAELRHLERGIHRVVAAVIEEVADVVRFEYRDQPLVLGAVLIDALELEPCRAEGPPGGVPERTDGRTALAADVD